MVFAIDLGGTTAKIGVFGEKEQKFLHHTLFPTRDLVEREVIEKLHTFCHTWLQEIGISESRINAFAFATVGAVDRKSGLVRKTKFNWENFPIRKVFQECFNKPVHLINDARAATYGELWKGAGVNHKNFIMYTIGTGIGGGIVINGHVYKGSHNYANELGHGGLMQNEFPCICGLKHCVEGLSSGAGIEHYLQNYLKKHPNSKLAALQKHKKNKLTIRQVAPLLKAGDPDTVKCFTNALKPLANHIAILIHSLDPSLVIIGGGPSIIGEPLISIIRKEVRKLTLKYTHNLVEIVSAKLKTMAGLYGTVYIGLQRYYSELTLLDFLL